MLPLVSFVEVLMERSLHFFLIIDEVRKWYRKPEKNYFD
jgi:hypothetical protein